MNFKLFKLIIHLFKLTITFCYVSIPLKIYDNKNIDKILLLSNDLDEQYFFVYLYKEIFIGEPKQKIIFILSPDEYNFYMVLDNNNEIKNDSYYYDFKKSKTNNLFLGEMEVGSSANTFFLKEKFYFDKIDSNINKEEEIGINGIDLVLYKKRPKFFNELLLSSNVNSYIIFGLRLCESFDRMEYALNLIRQLKKNNVTRNYKWFIDYNSNDNENNLKYGSTIKMFIGADPHDVYPNKYDENNLKLVNAKSNKGFIFWGLKFDKIYYYNKDNDKILFELNNNNNINTTNFEEYLTGEIKHNLFFISSPMQYFNSILKDFFNSLINEKKCFINGEKYRIIYCQNNEENKNYLKKNFKNLYFKHHEYNYIFVLKYEDLFLEYNNDKILFLIISEKNINNWILGIPFLKKYLFSFDYDFKVIGFYNKNNDEQKNNNKYFNFFKIFITILLLLICGISGFLLSKKIYGLKRKKRINEIDDYYQYKENKNEDDENIKINNSLFKNYQI